MDDIEEVLPDLAKAGYDARNDHVVWVLTNYHVAVERNQSRSRVVPDDILLKTHEGAANSIKNLLQQGGFLESFLDHFGCQNPFRNGPENYAKT